MKIIVRSDKCRGIPIALMIVVIFCLELFCTSVSASDNLYPAQLLDEAERQARKVKDEADRLFLLESIAINRAGIGQIKESRSLLKELEPHFAKSHGSGEYILAEIARQIARSGNVEAAVEAAIAAGSASTTVKVVTIKNRSASGSESNSDAENRKVPQSASSWKNDEPLYTIAEELAKRDMYESAIKIVDQTSRPDNIRRRAQVMNEFAAIAASRGWSEAANNLFERAELLSSQLMSDGEVNGAAVQMSLSIAAQRRLCGETSTADRKFLEIRDILYAVKNKEQKDQFLAELVAASAVAGNIILAKDTMAVITEPTRKIQASDAIANAQITYGHTEDALGLVHTIASADTRIPLLLLLAGIQAKSDPKLARITLNAIANSLEDSSDDYRAWFVANLASIEYTIGNRKHAIALWKQAIKLADRFTIHPDRERWNLIEHIAHLQAEVGDQKDALETAKMLRSRDIFSDISEAETRSGKAESAFRWIKKQKDPYIRAKALLGVLSGLSDIKEDKRRFGYYDLYECK